MKNFKFLTVLAMVLMLLTTIATVVYADEQTTIVLEENTIDYTYTSHPTYDSGATEIVVSDGVTTIGDYTFFKDTSIEKVELSDTVTTIGDYAFYGCTSLKSIDLSNVTSIGKYAFYGCTSLTEVTFNGEAGAHALDFEGDNQMAFSMNLARVEAMIDYLNEVYLTTDLGYQIDYCSPEDIEELQALADYITEGCTTETEKADAIYEWVKANITYGKGDGNDPSSPIDVFRYKTAVCSGYAELISTLSKLAGMPSAIVRCRKEDSTQVTLAFNYKWYKYHEFSMIYADGEWKQYDALYKYKGVSDKETIATYQWILHIDGVYAYSDEGFDLTCYNNRSADMYYYDGAYHALDIQHSFETGGSAMYVGACLCYSRWFYWAKEDYYKKYLGDKENLVVGLAYPEGWYMANSTSSDMFYIGSNGVQYMSGIKEGYLFNRGRTIKIDDSYLDIGLTNGDVNMYVGETLDFASADAIIISVSDNLSVEGTKITANESGTGSVVFQLNRNNKNKVTIYFNVYGDIITSNELFQELCDHDTTHIVNEVTYCDYCGEEITETIVEEDNEDNVDEVVKENNEEVIIEDKENNNTEEIIEENNTDAIEEIVGENNEEVTEESNKETVVEVTEEIVEKEQENVTVQEETTETTEKKDVVEEVTPTNIEQENNSVIVENMKNNNSEEEQQIIVSQNKVNPQTIEIKEEMEDAKEDEETSAVFTYFENVREEVVVFEEEEIVKVEQPTITYTTDTNVEENSKEIEELEEKDEKTNDIEVNTLEENKEKVQKQEQESFLSAIFIVVSNMFYSLSNFFKSLFDWLF